MIATIIASVMVVFVFILQEFSGDKPFISMVTQSIILFLLYFIIFFIALFALLNPFFDLLHQKVNPIPAMLITLVITNGVLVAGLFPDSSALLTEVLSLHLKLFLAANVTIIYFGWKKGLEKGRKVA